VGNVGYNGYVVYGLLGSNGKEFGDNPTFPYNIQNPFSGYMCKPSKKSQESGGRMRFFFSVTRRYNTGDLIVIVPAVRN
jgi:hypothetical protein